MGTRRRLLHWRDQGLRPLVPASLVATMAVPRLPQMNSPIADPARPDDPDRTEAVKVESIRLQYESMANAYVASGVLATVVAAIYQPSMPGPIWMAWLAAMYLHVAARSLLRRRFMRAAPPPQEMARWGRYAVCGTLASGVLWGAGTVLGLIYSEGVMEFLLVPLILLLSVAAAVSAISYLPVYYAFFIPSTMPGIVAFLIGADQLRFLTGIAYLCFMLMVTRFAHVLHESFITSTRLRFENANLVRALRTEKAAAEEANLAKSRFLAAASHDLRQPVHALSLFIESLSTAPLPTREATIVSNMRKSTDAMGSLFDSLLDMSRLDAGTVEPQPAHFEVGPFGMRLYREFQPLAQARGLQMRLRTSDRIVFTDPVLLNRIVSNLLANAVRYGAREGVLLALRPRRGQLAIEVWDTGIGIPEGARSDVFREFFQVGNSERDREKGLGLGLAIVDRLVKLLDLTLEMRSRPGVGSMFRILVPLGQRFHATQAPDEGRSEGPPLSERFALSVFVIDDERAVREATGLLLARWGCRVVTAGSVDELGDLTEGASVPDLIVADLRLRDGETGITAVQTLRARFSREIPAVIVTGDTMPARLKEVRESGMAVLHKPLQPSNLRALLGTLDAARAQRASGQSCSGS